MDNEEIRRSKRIAQKTAQSIIPGCSDGNKDKDRPQQVSAVITPCEDTTILRSEERFTAGAGQKSTSNMVTHDPSMQPSLQSPRSKNSHASTASRRRLLEARATRERVELERERIEFEKLHIEQQRRLEKQHIEHARRLEKQHIEHERRLEEERLNAEKALIQLTALSKVQQWIDDNLHDSDGDAPPVKYEDADVNLRERQDNDIAKLTRAITDALRFSSGSAPVSDKLLGRLSAKDLPSFSGDPLDWLRFKNAYKTTTQIGQYSDQENVARLQRCLHGEAWEAVAARLITATSADEVMKTLEIRFGRPDLVLHKLICEMKKVPKLYDTRADLIVLATKVSNCAAAIEATKHIGYLHSPDLISEVINKLSEPLVYRWLDYSARLDDYQPRLPALAEYLMKEAEQVCRASAVELPQKISKYLLPPSTSKQPVLMMTEEKNKQCPFCEKTNHALDTCPSFQNEDINKRWEWICQKRLCFKCLSSKHRRDRCKSKKKCSTCKCGHHSILPRNDWSKPDKVEALETTANVWAKQNKKVLLKVLPIVVVGPAGSVNTYALLDEGSTITLVERQIAEEVGANGPETDLSIQGAIGDGNQMISRIVSLTLRSPEGVYRLDRVCTVDNLNLPTQTLDESILSQYQHLQEIPLQIFKGQPTLLIGQDYWHLIVSRELREGKKNEPVASLTRLGWVLHGFVSSITGDLQNFSLHVRENNDEDLHELVKDFFRLESIGIKHEDSRRYSPEERRALDILETKTKRIGDKWETGLLWRSDDVELPNSRRHAEHRLRIIEKNMDSDPAFAADYTKQVDNMLKKNYAQEVSGFVQGKRVWYLPHFGVRNPNKPGKLRLVFDAKAETKGISLNSELVTGPDLLNSLLGVLLRFRERAVAVTADIREMFLQIKIIEEDQKAQCFLWRGMDRESPPRIYMMTSMIFGATSSPCTATYILRHNAEDYASTHPRAAMAINKRHYVDDYIDSVDTEEEMRQLVSDVIMIHKAGGFEIRGWASNRQNVLPHHSNNSSVNLLQQIDNVERTLGLNWRPTADSLGFDLSLKKVDKAVADGLRRPTKREILKVIMSVFDPLGLLCPLLIRGKILLQEVWRSGIQWDEQLCEMAAKTWFHWLNDLKNCQTFSIPRCYGFNVMESVQLHVFVDASEQAYASVAYLRKNGEVAFVAAKSRVAPLKSSTIPRLELQAALMGTRLGVTIEKEHDIKIEKRFFWTDSQTVWWWINCGSRQNKPFISNRLAEIDEMTQPQEWRWLPGHMNVADEATRANSKLNLATSKWIVGPEFLRLTEDEWPTFTPKPETEEEPSEFQGDVVLAVVEQGKLVEDSRFSNWRRLVRTLAMVLLFTDKCRRPNCQLSPEYERRAEILILRQAQSDSFPDDIAAIENGQSVKLASKLRQLNPELDETGLLRLKSRIEAGRDLSLGLRRPVILDGRHHVARLIIDYKHRELGHHSIETLVNEIRQWYYILRLRGTVRFIIARCVICRTRRARCEQPMMAGLPPARLQHHCRPFTYCGVDLFGPMLVTIGRRNEKRWGVLFTCFSTRAVHIELAASLSTDSTLLAIRRMASRRGYPKQIYSDNGTNFRGADKELRSAAKQILEDTQLIDKTTALGIDWRFNPPEAPHMGGAWERLVRSIKIALYATLRSRAPKEEVLVTLIAEAENIVNSRPLTHVSLDPNEEEALTPNHFLLGASNGLPRPGEFSDQDLSLRRQWRVAQRLSDHFWSRWMREYLPNLQTRKKWTADNCRNVAVGDLVLIADSRAPRNVWARGRVIATTPGRDGRVRIVDVATQGGAFRRPVTKIVVLLRADDTENSASCHHESL